MSGVTQAAFMNQRSFVPPLPVAIGASYEGGYFAGQIVTGGNYFNLVVAPKSSGQNIKAWKTTNTSTAGTSSVIDGPTNSANMNNASHPAAQFCEGLTIGGYSDWYMPAKNELEVCYYNLKPGTQNNDTGSGINNNAVPSRSSNYTTSIPSQTSAAIFKTGSSEDFTFGFYYWSSTEYSATIAYNQYFLNGRQRYSDFKNGTQYVRAIRRVAA